MPGNIRSILKHSSYSDGGTTGRDDPPTFQDREMRKKHTQDSVLYNLQHVKDHMAELIASLGKLQGVDRAKTRELAEKVCKALDAEYGAVEEYK